MPKKPSRTYRFSSERLNPIRMIRKRAGEGSFAGFFHAHNKKGSDQMASFHFEIKSGAKGVAADHSTYIARQGWYRHRKDLMFSGHGNLPDWANDNPASFWKAADKYERANGAVYRELVIALPHELTPEQLRAMVERLIRELDGIRTYQYAVHASESSLQGAENCHLHLMYSERMPDGIERSEQKMFSRYNSKDPAKGGRRKGSSGRTLLQVRHELVASRRAAANIQNAFLTVYGHSARVDHRTLAEQGENRKPERHLGQATINHMSSEEKAAYVIGRKAIKS